MYFTATGVLQEQSVATPMNKSATLRGESKFGTNFLCATKRVSFLKFCVYPAIVKKFTTLKILCCKEK